MDFKQAMNLKPRIRRKRRQLVHDTRRLVVDKLGLWPDRPKVLAISPPKSGTNLLSRCLELLPGMRNVRDAVERPSGLVSLEKKLERVHRGSFTSGHVHFTPEYKQLVQDLGLFSILIIRDPRDLAVSLLHWAAHKLKQHRLHPYLTSLQDDSERLMAIIQGIEPHLLGTRRGLENIGDYVGMFLPWIGHGSCLIRFEHLVGPQGGGSRDLQVQEIKKLATHLNIVVDDQEIEHIADSTFDRNSRTFRKGQIGDWQNHFEPKHKAAFKELAGRLLLDLGYESHRDW